VRGDVGDLSQAQIIIVLAHAVALLIAPPGSSIAEVSGLKRLTVGVVGGEMNRNVVTALTEEYDLGRANVTFRNLAPSETRRALDNKEVRALLVGLAAHSRRRSDHAQGFVLSGCEQAARQ
jgi:ABC-type nitrate/sulfonate/bicarbonate transport system substrate-binding protein